MSEPASAGQEEEQKTQKPANAPGILQEVPVSSTLTSSLLALGGGYLDGFTYVGHGHVFANAMTGNVVLLGISCVSGTWQTGFRHLPPIVAFIIGISAARIMKLPGARSRIRFPNLSVLALEIAILSVISVLPQSTGAFWITTSIAFAASVQVATFRDVNGRSYNSTFTTGNLRTLSEAIVDRFSSERKPETGRVIRDFSLICLSFLAGAMGGGFVTPKLGNRALWLEIALLAVVAIRNWPTRNRTSPA
ncbi:uncharacterized membrane protein YoaK (UPF0700 family) [Silvibacterium bohemicum]|uniref:Uncharacterized membrane protein YoaK (UPF0700 family) n=1 Tax=Silvibacterium bohemicum TaxID=1577686 RepID=A0A841JPG9_9BACT|nr:YoaK family protein [Silvibacterium bohemicum]MBB6143246.1 uncharacterized membrane protein YoaK (UPF0700 family) [Silvibacterium bohemicum]